MRHKIELMTGWQFTGPDGRKIPVDLPHTWNNTDGQDGGNDYQRCRCKYELTFPAPAFDAETQEVWLEFDGVNSSAVVSVNGQSACTHEGGYSTFRAHITEFLQQTNTLTVIADNSVNDTVYPQKADFTFYGGIYRGVRLLVVNKAHFALNFLGSSGVRVTATPDGASAAVRVKSRVTAGEVAITLLDAEGRVVGHGEGLDCTILLRHAHLWHGVDDPYLYTCRAQVKADGCITDEIDIPFGVRSFRVDPQIGFILNGKPFPLHGVSRHQDRRGVGNALTREMHDEDMALISEMGCNTIRLAHYQHDQYFYDLCDRYGMIVWAEIPYISHHMPGGRNNTISQMQELIEQNYNHPSIVCWGISNEITITRSDRKDMLNNHYVLNDLAHQADPTRFTTLACYALCSPVHPVAHITDTVSWNLYLGWYVPGLFLNDLWISFFHLIYPRRPLGYSEYGAEGMPNLHSSHPRRNDHTEEYQARYHEFMLRCFRRHPFLWATHVWNMFDFAADARDQGGEPGMNHKGLVTFDRKTRKDSFYLYKAWWGKEKFVHICSKRYVERTDKITAIRVYSTEETVQLLVNGEVVDEQTRDDHIFTFRIPLEGEVRVEAVSGNATDSAVFRHVASPNRDYILPRKKHRQKSNWI